MHDAGELVERGLDSNEGNAVNAAEGDSNDHGVVSRAIEHNAVHQPFVAYEAIRDALVARGLPHHEIAFIQDATTRAKREHS
jgi:hypothetical protein